MFRLIDEEKTRHSVSRMSRLLGVSRQGYYKHHHRTQEGSTAKELSDTDLSKRIQDHHERSRGTYGSPRIQADLAEIDGIRTGRKGLTRQDRMATAPPDLVERDFTAHAPNTKWTADIERCEALLNPAVMKGHRSRPVAAG